jgi:hypothetical protein
MRSLCKGQASHFIMVRIGEMRGFKFLKCKALNKQKAANR